MSGTAEPASPAPARRSRGRSVVVFVVLVLAGLLLLLSSFAIWVNRVALNTDVFADTSTELIEDDAIRQAVSTRVVDELFESVDVEAELQEQLPPDYQRLAGPAAAGFREAAYRLVDRALQQPRLQRLWEASIEQSHRTLVAVLEGDEGTVSTTEGVVSLDLEPIVLEAADRIGLREQVADNLPPDVGQIEILSSDELDAAQDGFQILKALAWFLPVLTLIAFAIAAWVARDRRRLVRKIGITVVVVAVVGLLAVNVVGNYIVDSLVSDSENRTAASNAWDILTQLLKSSFWWMIPIGVLFVVASWLAAPGPRALGARRYLAPALRDRLWPYVALALIAVFLVLTGPVSDVSRYIVVAALIVPGRRLDRGHAAADEEGVPGCERRRNARRAAHPDVRMVGERATAGRACSGVGTPGPGRGTRRSGRDRPPGVAVGAPRERRADGRGVRVRQGARAVRDMTSRKAHRPERRIPRRGLGSRTRAPDGRDLAGRRGRPAHWRSTRRSGATSGASRSTIRRWPHAAGRRSASSSGSPSRLPP